MKSNKTIQFFDKNFTSIIEVDPYYEKYYLKKGFKKIKSEFSKFAYLKFFRFPKLILRLLKNVKITFMNSELKSPALNNFSRNLILYLIFNK